MSSISKLNRFVMNPTNLDISRSKFNRPHTHKTTFKSGKLIPFYLDEVLPGDTFKVNVSSVVRMLTPAVPVMDNCFLDLYFFFVPNRLCTAGRDDWQKICGENTAGFWANDVEYTLENTGNLINLSNQAFKTYGIKPGSVMNYLGLPIINPAHAPALSDSNFMNNFKVSALPLRAYCSIWNEFFRDQNVQSPKEIVNPDFWRELHLYEDCFSVNKLHDYFTSALPSPQKGDPVLIPLGNYAPVVSSNSEGAIHVQEITGSPATGTLSVLGSSIVDSNDLAIKFTNLQADLSNASAASINNLRQAFAIQRMLERDARGGTRYRSMLKSHFGVTIPDATVQVPEYLGGKRIPLNITQVLQTSETTEESPLGATGAFSNTSFSDSMFIKSFTEYGYIMCVGCVRTEQSYSQGIPKMWTRNRRYDFYYPVFANLGEQIVDKKELYLPCHSETSSYAITNMIDKNVFGYQEAWAEYRYHPNLVTGNLAPNARDNTLTAWTYTNDFTSIPVLNSDFIQQPSSQIGDTLVITDTDTQFVADFYFDIETTRPMPVYSIPGLIDHH